MKKPKRESGGGWGTPLLGGGASQAQMASLIKSHRVCNFMKCQISDYLEKKTQKYIKEWGQEAVCEISKSCDHGQRN